MANQTILKALERVRHKLGPVTRKDGMVVPLFIDTVPLMFEPDLFKLTAVELAREVRQMPGITLVAGGMTPGVPLAAAVALELGMRLAWVRKEPKGYSQNRVVDGNIKNGDKVVLIDDFYVSGEMKDIFIGHLRNAGAIVTHVLSIGMLSQQLLDDWKTHRSDIEIRYCASYIDMAIQLEGAGIISTGLREVVEYFVTDPYHWHENESMWNKFQLLLPNEVLAKTI